VTTYSLRRRLVLVMTGVMMTIFIVVGVFLYAGVRDAAWQQHDDGLRARARAFSALVEHSDDGYEIEHPPELRDSFVEVVLPDGHVDVWRRGGKPHFAALVARPVSIQPPQLIDVTLPDGRPGRAVVIRFVPRDEIGGAEPAALILAEDIEDVARSLRWLATLFIVVGIAALAAITTLVWWIVGRTLRPLDKLAQSLDTIDEKRLATRIALDEQPLELHAPIRRLNELLDRLETSFARERQFTADVSHELRTPLAGLRTLLEVTALSERTTADYRAALADAHRIVLQLGTLVENLLVLARLDAGHVAIHSTDVDLHELVDECWQPNAEIAASRALSFRNLASTTLSLDREKLRIVLANLLANAAEYTDRGGWIEVASTDSAITITDSGPPLPDEHKIFDRLWRGDAARSGIGVHCGIGLSLARSLCTAMSLSLTAENCGDGSVRFTCMRTRTPSARGTL